MKKPNRVTLQIEFEDMRDARKALRLLSENLQVDEHAKWSGAHLDANERIENDKSSK